MGLINWIVEKLRPFATDYQLNPQTITYHWEEITKDWQYAMLEISTYTGPGKCYKSFKIHQDLYDLQKQFKSGFDCFISDRIEKKWLQHKMLSRINNYDIKLDYWSHYFTGADKQMECPNCREGEATIIPLFTSNSYLCNQPTCSYYDLEYAIRVYTASFDDDDIKLPDGQGFLYDSDDSD